jgi:hypothetical protein
MTGDREALVQDLKRTAEAFGYDRAAYTEEVRWTDRVMAFHSKYALHYMDQKLPRPSLGLLYSSVTGDFGNPLYFPMNAVRWQTPPQDIAAMVIDHSTHGMQAELYHFGDSERAMGAALYLLKEGVYKWTLRAAGKTISERAFDVAGARIQINFTLPSRTLCVLQIERVR